MFKSLGENLLLKIIALATAIVIWLYVVGSERSPIMPRQVMAEVQAVGSAPEDLLVQIKTPAVPVAITGPKNELDRIADNEIKAIVDLSAARSNVTQLKIVRYEKPPDAPNVVCEGMRMHVSVEVTEKKRKLMPITVSFDNEAPFGKRYSNPRIRPTQATVIGTEEDLSRVDKLIVYVDTQGGSVRTDPPIKAVDRDGIILEQLQVEPPTAHVEIDLIEAPATRTLVVSAQPLGRPPYPYAIAEIRTEPDQVTVMGRPELLTPLTHISTAEIPVDNLKADTERQVPLQLPPGVTIKDGRTSVRVLIKVRDTTKLNP